MKTLFTLCFALLSTAAFSQAQMTFHGNIGVKFANGSAGSPIYLVIDNPDQYALRDGDVAPGVTDIAGGPAIFSESEYHIVKWNVGTSAGLYTVPFFSPTLDYVAVSVNVPAAGTGVNATATPGRLEFSTYHHNNALATTPSDVTHMNLDLTGLAGGENDAIDRFWIIDALGYSTKPNNVNVAFLYDPLELEGTMNGDNLLIQRFNPSNSSWHDVVIPTVSTVLNQDALATAPVSDANFFRSWTLTNASNPLPIELLSFNSECKGDEGVLLNWNTATEVNNSHFTLERSEDGIFWETFADNIHGAGNSSAEISYSHLDNNPFRGLTYYRLSQTDFDGTSEVFDPVVSDCDGVGFEIINAFSDNGNQLQMTVSAGHDEAFNVEILDINGKVVASQQSVMLLEGLNYFMVDKSNLSYGMYVIKLQSATQLMTRKILLN